MDSVIEIKRFYVPSVTIEKVLSATRRCQVVVRAIILRDLKSKLGQRLTKLQKKYY